MASRYASQALADGLRPGCGAGVSPPESVVTSPAPLAGFAGGESVSPRWPVWGASGRWSPGRADWPVLAVSVAHAAVATRPPPPSNRRRSSLDECRFPVQFVVATIPDALRL